MEAATLNCPMCGAPSASDATLCAHCHARLATVACPSCFGMIFLGAKFCQHCGGKVARADEADAAPKPCPHCRAALNAVALGGTHVHECPKCEGLWLDTETFNTICADRERQMAVIADSPAPAADAADFKLSEVRYVPCPSCAKLMNRVNFAHASAVVLDICKPHGVWCDRDELRRIVEFIRAGGLDAARKRDREAWETDKRTKASFNPKPAPQSFEPGADLSGGSGLSDVIEVIGRILWNLWR